MMERFYYTRRSLENKQKSKLRLIPVEISVTGRVPELVTGSVTGPANITVRVRYLLVFF